VFEKLLCLADFIEDTRKYNDCVSLRKAFWEKITPENRTAVLDEALLRYFENTIAHVEAKGGYVNEKTIQARQFLIKNNVVLYNLL